MRSLMTVLGLFGCVQVIQAQDHHAVDKPINEVSYVNAKYVQYQIIKHSPPFAGTIFIHTSLIIQASIDHA